MKGSILFLALTLVMMSCTSTSNKTEESKDDVLVKSVEEQMYSVDGLYANVDSLEGKEISIYGSVTHTCKHSGQRCFLVGDSADQTIRVEAGGNIQGFGAELIGSTIRVKGVLKASKINPDEIQKMEEEVATKEKSSDEGEVESCAAEKQNIHAMREWMKNNNKNYYATYYFEGADYEVVE